jgi:hypothetical protein
LERYITLGRLDPSRSLWLFFASYGAIAARTLDFGRLGDSSVYYFALLPQDVEVDGLGAEYHPSERTQVKMAKQLVSVLRAFAKW